MSQYGVIYNVAVQDNVSGVFNAINQSINGSTVKVGGFDTALQSLATSSFGLNQVRDAFKNLGESLNSALAPGIALDTKMHDLSAITGLTGKALKDVENNARSSAKVFGIDAAQSVEAYKLILSQLSPDIANNSEALKAMGNNVSILSKTMGNDAVAATEVLTTAMNQYGVDLSDPIKASQVMSNMMNTMAAAAKEGSAELPAIQSALQQAGMMASSSGVQFEELNAAIQVLDKAGKKGAEGGVAIRNMLAELGTGRFQTKEVKVGLEGLGISVDVLADKNTTLADKLRILKPLQNDTALLTKMFGKENEAAALALIKNADTIDTLKTKITGTSTATEQAGIVMDSYAEKSNRVAQVFNDLKISLFNATSSLTPYVTTIGSGINDVGMFAGNIFNIGNALGKVDYSKMLEGLKSSTLLTNISTGAMTAMGAVTKGTVMTTMIPSLSSLGYAIMSIPIVGWIAGAVVALGAIGYYLWETWKPFRATLYGLWEAAQTVFHNIGQFFTNVWDMVIKPIIGFIGTYFKLLWDGLVIGVKFIFNIYKTVFTAIYDAIVFVVKGIITAFTAMWDGIVYGAQWLWTALKSAFGGIATSFDEWIIQPISKAFNYVWDIITGVFDKITTKMKALFAPIMAIWDKIFGTGMKDVKASFEVGYKKGEADFDADKKTTTADGKATASTANKPNVIKQPSLPANGGGTKASGSAGGGSGSNSGNKNIHITINGGINATVHTTNSSDSPSKIKQMVTEAMLGAVNDANLAN